MTRPPLTTTRFPVYSLYRLGTLSSTRRLKPTIGTTLSLEAGTSLQIGEHCFDAIKPERHDEAV